MSNSDYLIKATIKKISEKLNKTFSSTIDEATTAAQEVPELLKKEIEILKDEIIAEAKGWRKKIVRNHLTKKISRKIQFL